MPTQQDIIRIRVFDQGHGALTEGRQREDRYVALWHWESTLDPRAGATGPTPQAARAALISAYRPKR